MGYSYEIAKEVLTEAEKNRFLCLYLHCEPSAIDWEKATVEFGSASADSMRVSVRNSLKKIEKAGGKLDDNGNATASPAASASATPTKSGAKKRKAAAAVGDGDADDVEATPTKKRGGRKPKAEASPPKSDDGEVDGGVAVKAEEAVEH